MNQAQHEKLKNLILASPILSPDERGEWTALLELMDDKQMGELEAILESGKWKVESGKVDNRNIGILSLKALPTPAAEPINRHATGQATNYSPPITSKMPKLSHIMNLPRMSGELPESQNVLLMQQVPAKKSPFSIFGAKLKAMLGEKELPVGNSLYPLELTDGKEHTPPKVAAPKFVVSLPPVSPVKEPIMALDQNRPGLIASPTSLVKFSNGVNPVLPHPPVPKPPAKPPILTPLPETRPFIPSQPKPTGAKMLLESEAGLTSGLSFVKMSEKAKQDVLASIKQHLTPTIQVIQKPGLPKPEGMFENMTDLNRLSANILLGYDFIELVSKIKNLILKSGYHEVIFNIEKSSLYKNYIRTGLAILSQGKDFEQLNSSAENPSLEIEKYLTRQEFEKTADLLRKLQTG